MNGINAYALFALYAITIAPSIGGFIEKGGKNYLIAIFGMLLLVLEYYALKFKLFMVRIRAEQRLVELEKEFGDNIIINPGKFLAFWLFIRLIYRMCILLMVATALGFKFSEKHMSGAGLIIIVVGFGIEVYGLIKTYLESGIYKDQILKSDLYFEKQDREKWRNEYLPKSDTMEYISKEFYADIILQVYAVILYSLFWYFVNDAGFRQIRDGIDIGEDSISIGVNIFFMFLFMMCLGLIPIRIAYWIEDSMHALTKKEKYAMSFIFIIAGFYTCLPTVFKYQITFNNLSLSSREYLQSAELQFYLSILIILVVALTHVVRASIKSAKWNKIIIKDF